MSLTAGLLVTMGIVGLSREATNTFHEEIRTANAESATRTSVDRLRADLQRAAFMSTGNIQRDPLIAKAPGAPNVDPTVASNFKGLARLAGIHLFLGGSAAATPLSASQTPALNPDAIEIAGNFSSTDQFVVRNIDVSPASGCQRIWLAVDSPPMWRILATQFSNEGGISGAADQNLINAFQPYTSAGQFIVRIVDTTGHTQYVATCAGTAAGGASLSVPTPWVDIDLKTPILTTQLTKTVGGSGGVCAGCLINPVQIVRWELLASAGGALNPLVPEAGVLGDGTKYDLVRSYVDAASGNAIAGSGEAIAEYAVDLKFAVTADSSADVTGQNPVLNTFALDDESSSGSYEWAKDVSTSTVAPFSKGPQRIRDVRFRLVTRAASADRKTNITAPPAGNIAQRYIFRYCAGALGSDGGLPDCTQQTTDVWARARTIVAESALGNQARMYYQ